MKKKATWLVGIALPMGFLSMQACGGDDTIEAFDVDADASRRDATPVPPPPSSSSGSSGTTSGGTSSGDIDLDAGDADVPDGDVPDADVPDADAGPLPTYTPFEFIQAAGAAFCTRYESCCAGAPGRPTSGRPTCISTISQQTFLGGVFSSYFINSNVAARDRVKVDAQRAQQCISALEGLACYVNNGALSSASWKALFQACTFVLQGEGRDGEECFSDAECDTDHVCQGAAGATAGQCRGFQALGEAAIKSGSWLGDSCSYKGQGFVTGRRGMAEPFPAAGNPLVPARACTVQSELGEACFFDWDCKSHACSAEIGESSACSAFKFDPYLCEAFIPPPNP